MKKSRTLKSIGEFGLIHEIEKWVPCAKDVVQGIGDDTAVFQGRDGRYQLFTIDTLVEGVDFRMNQATAQQIGWKALAINLSDIAAMGGMPLYALVSVSLPKKTPVTKALGIFRGLSAAAKKYGVSVVGGDTSHNSHGIHLAVTLIGAHLPL